MSATNQVNTRVPASIGEDMGELGASSANKNNAQRMHSGMGGQKAKVHPKTSKAYWLDKVKKPPSSAGGLSPHYGIQLAYRGRRMRFSLDTADKEAAAVKAAKIWTQLSREGWDMVLLAFKPRVIHAKSAATVGSLIEASKRLSSARAESLDAYAKALRRIAAGVIGLDSGRKYDFKRGSAEWRAKVDAVPLERLAPANVLAWKNAYLKAARTPDERKRACVTVNSLIRNSKALLGKRVRSFIADEMHLPSPLWFEGIAMEEEPSLRYKSRIDAGKIIASARTELAKQKPEAFKLLLLTLFCGLRRSEADSLLWEQIDLEKGEMDVRDNDFKRLKSKDSAGVIGLDKELVAAFRGYRARASGAFVLETPQRARKPISEHSSRGYRCDGIHQELIQWLKANGVPGLRPIHALRKEIGSIIASRDGIFKASRYLRHSDIRTTNRLYADTKTPVCAGLGGLLLVEDDNVIQFPASFVQAIEKTQKKGKETA